MNFITEKLSSRSERERVRDNPCVARDVVLLNYIIYVIYDLTRYI